MNEFKRNIFMSELEEVAPSVFLISSSVVSAGAGTLDISGAQPNEVIGLSFSVTPEPSVFNGLSFSPPVSVGSLENVHLSRNGSMAVDVSGTGSSTYLFDPTSTTSSCLVTVTYRSSGLTDGIGDTTNII